MGTSVCMQHGIAVTVQSVLSRLLPLALPLLPILVGHLAALEGGESLVHNLTYMVCDIKG